MGTIRTAALVNSEIISGLLLIISFFVALCIANVDIWSESYKYIVFLPISFGYGQLIYQSPLINLVNDGLMTFFFLLIGLELKFHLECGEYKNRKTLILPTAAAMGGVAIPALIYSYLNFGTSTIEGWAIPIATDTAFMLGILSLFGKIIPPQLRAFIISFSLIDDTLALSILALFYSKSSSIIALTSSAGLIVVLLALNRFNVKSNWCYLGVGFFLWIAMVHAGIHGTLCGIIVALTIPAQIKDKLNPSFRALEHFLRPVVYFALLPVFAFLNSGVNFEYFSLEIFTSNITLGIILGLFIGKQLGIFGFSYMVVKSRLCSLPRNVSWGHFYAVAVLGGVGFTLSLFIGDLTFEANEPNYAMRAGVIIGSLLSTSLCTLILMYLSRARK